MQIDRDQLLSEIKLRKHIQEMIAENVEKWAVSRNKDKGDEIRLRGFIRSLISEVKQDLKEQDFENNPEKEMFNLVKKEIAGLLKSSIKTLKDGQSGDAEQVQIGHLKAIILAINNLFDQVESAEGALEREKLKEAIEVDIGDTLEDVTRNPMYMSADAMENDGNDREEEEEINIEDASEDEIEKLTMGLQEDDIQTLEDSIRAQDPENASYQILGVRRALNKKTGSWNKVKNNFINFADLVWGANLPEIAWKTFRKWVIENVRLHLINTIQETASEVSVEEPSIDDFSPDEMGSEELPAEELPAEELPAEELPAKI